MGIKKIDELSVQQQRQATLNTIISLVLSKQDVSYLHFRILSIVFITLLELAAACFLQSQGQLMTPQCHQMKELLW